MRLLLLAGEFPPGPGGIGTHAHHLATGLTALGWEVTVVAPQDHADSAEVAAFTRAQPFRLVRQRAGTTVPRGLAARAATAFRAARAARPHVVVASGRRDVWVGEAVARAFRLPWVAVGHGTEFTAGRWWDLRLTRRAFRRADAVVTVSEYTRALMLAAGIHPTRESVIPNGADDGVFRPGPEGGEVRRRLGIAEGAPVLLTVGSVKGRKGQDTVIRALPRLLGRFPDLVYLVAGRPYPHPPFTALAASLGVADHVRFLGRVSPQELPALYNACDVYVLLSRSTAGGDVEGYGISIVEAALSGKPALATRGCGTEEAVREGRTGLLVDQDDADGAAEALERLLGDPEGRLRMGGHAREAALGGTWTHRVAAYDGVLRGVAAP